MSGTDEIQERKAFMKRKRSRSEKIAQILKYPAVVLAAGLVVVLVFLFAKPASAESDFEFPHHYETADELDQEALRKLYSQQEQPVQEVIAEMSSVDQSRRESVWESVSESESESLSIALEEASIEASIEQSEYESYMESSIAESSSIAEEQALNAPLAGSHLIAQQVVWNCDDTDIPYLRSLFSHCIVIGNSRAKNAVDCGIMTEREVRYLSGAPVERIWPMARDIAYAYYPKTLFIVGLNDIGYYDGSNERFYQDLYGMIKEYKSINPGIVYLQEILPCPEEARPYFYRFFMIPDFNARIQQVCQELDCIYVTASPYADFKYINSHDHAHYGKPFYFLWAQTIASQMHLWEDMAGMDYDVPYSLPVDEEGKLLPWASEPTEAEEPSGSEAE